MEYLSLGIAYLLELIITVTFANRLMETKIKKPLIYLYSLPVYVASYGLFFVAKSVILNILASIVMFLFTMVVGYSDKFIKKIVYTIYLFIFMYCSELVLTVPAFKQFTLVTNETNSDMAMLLMSITTKILFFVFAQLFVIIIKPKEFNNNKKYLVLFLYPISSYALIVFVFNVFDKFSVALNNYWILYTLAIVITIASVMVFSYYQYIDRKDKQIKELEKERQFAELNNSYMQVLEHQNNELQMVFHDTKHHFMALDNMDNADDMKSYIHKIVPAMESNNNVSVSSNKMLNLLLNKYIVICKSKGIKFTYDVKTVSLDYIDDAELSILICNILDNAIESAEQSKGKSINISIKHINSMDLLSVENSCDIEPKHKNGKLITSKADAQNHGYGTKIIEKHSKMNNGQMEWSYDNVEHIFHLNILFQKW